MGVKSLYTVIPHHECLKALKFFFDKCPTQELSTTTLIHMAELVLTLNNFYFHGEHYHQISGVAMGTKLGPNYANLFVGFVEKQLFEYTGPMPDYFGRYIDNCLGTASCSCVDLERFINFVNGFHSSLQFTWEISETSVSFLDILVSINGNKFTTSVFYKPTDTHSYLLYSSSHPNHTKRSIPFSQQGYPTPLLETALTKAAQIPLMDTLTDSVVNVSKTMPLVLTYHPSISK